MQPNQVSRRVSIEVMGRPSISRRFPLISRQIILSACEDTLPSLLGACNRASDKVPTVLAEAATQ